MKACEFVAKHVLSKSSKVEASRIVWSVTRVQTEGLPTFKLVLSILFDDTELSQQTCEVCKQFHKSFYINEQYNCNSCNKIGYSKRLDERLSNVMAYYKKIMDEELNKF